MPCIVEHVSGILGENTYHNYFSRTVCLYVGKGGCKLKDFTCCTSIEGLPYHRTEYTLLPLLDTKECFIRAAAEFFIQSWMSAAMPRMRDVWLSWDEASEEDRQDYLSYLDHLFSQGILIDNPAKGIGQTAPIATFSETMLRWLSSHSASEQLLVEPPEPAPPSEGKIDLIEITGVRGDYASMKLTMWEAKSSDNQANGQQGKIYDQLTAYPHRFYRVANSLANRHKDERDPAFLLFLQNMLRMVRNRQPQVHYGVFITCDANVKQKGTFVSNLHKYPPSHPVTGERCHHLALFLIPNFMELRFDVWRCLHLI